MQTFTLGCDPELVVRRNGQFVSASKYLKSSSSFGLDGCDSIAEIRPGFSESPIDLTSKIYQILEYGYDKFPELEFYSGHFCDGYSVGGHTHMSLDPEPKIIEALDVVLGSLSNCIDDKQKGMQKRRRLVIKDTYEPVREFSTAFAFIRFHSSLLFLSSLIEIVLNPGIKTERK